MKATTDYAALVFGRHRLALPQPALRTLEPAADVDPFEPPPGGVGWIASGAGRWQVFALDDDLRPTQTLLSGRRICALLGTGNGLLGLLCDDLQTVAQAEAQVHALPPAMGLPGSPLRGILTCAKFSAALTSVEALSAHLLAEGAA